MNKKKTSPLTIEPIIKAKSCVICAHGLGASADDFAWLPSQLNLPNSLATQFIFPQAPTQPVSLNGGFSMPSWFDIMRLDNSGQINLNQLKESRDVLFQLIDKAIASGIPANKIIVSGFSQGGALALFTGLSYTKKLGGILGMSTFLSPMDNIASDFQTANIDTSILLTHGTLDQVAPLSLGKATFDELAEKKYPTILKQYPMEHTVSLDALSDIRKWLLQILS